MDGFNTQAVGAIAMLRVIPMPVYVIQFQYRKR